MPDASPLTIPQLLTPSRFRSWLSSLPTDTTFDQNDPTRCAIARYLHAHGHRTLVFSDHISPGATADPEASIALPWAFRAVALMCKYSASPADVLATFDLAAAEAPSVPRAAQE